VIFRNYKDLISVIDKLCQVIIIIFSLTHFHIESLTHSLFSRNYSFALLETYSLTVFFTFFITHSSTSIPPLWWLLLRWLTLLLYDTGQSTESQHVPVRKYSCYRRVAGKSSAVTESSDQLGTR